jgi:hypothetical protein
MILAVLGSAMRDENHEQRREQVRQLPRRDAADPHVAHRGTDAAWPRMSGQLVKPLCVVSHELPTALARAMLDLLGGR